MAETPKEELTVDRVEQYPGPSMVAKEEPPILDRLERLEEQFRQETNRRIEWEEMLTQRVGRLEQAVGLGPWPAGR